MKRADSKMVQILKLGSRRTFNMLMLKNDDNNNQF
jgi:hypothetical protein